jgi:hypothetical protein
MRLAERDWQQRVVDLARLRRWRTYHVFDSRRSEPGWPDLVMLREARCVVAELKSEHGRLTTAQEVWLTAFRQVPAVEVFVWRPADWQTVIGVLK